MSSSLYEAHEKAEIDRIKGEAFNAYCHGLMRVTFAAVFVVAAITLLSAV